MIRLKIDLSKVLKEHLFKGKNGAEYLDVTLMENRDGPDRFGNDYMAVQDVGKEARMAGKRGPILGNAKAYPDRGASTQSESMQHPPRTASTPSTPANDDSITF